MPYMDETGLAYYSGKLKPWIASQPVKTLPSSLYPWTLTAKAGAVTCWPVGGTQLLPTVDFMFSETGPASGDKGPSNPSTITGVQEVKLFHSNSNMLYLPYYDSKRNYGSGALTMTANADGSVSVSGKYSSNGTLRLFATYPGSLGLPVKNGLTYYNTSKGDTYQPQLRFYNDKTTNVAKFVSAGSSWLYNLGDSTTTVAIVYPANLDLTATTAIIFPSLSIVPYDGPWEQPETVVHNVDLGSTYYGGEIDLATGLMTVTQQGYVYSSLDGISTNWGTSTNVFSILNRAVSKGVGLSNEVCSHFITDPTWSGAYIHYYEGSTSSYFFNPNWTNKQNAIDFFKAEALAGRPVTVSYELAEPFTVQLSPFSLLSLTQADKYTPRLNTIYTDAQSVQVGYVKSPIREEFELQQAVVAQGGSI